MKLGIKLLKNIALSGIIVSGTESSIGQQLPEKNKLKICEEYSETIKQHPSLKEELSKAMDKSIKWYNKQGIPAKRENSKNCRKVSFSSQREYIESYIQNINDVLEENKLELELKEGNYEEKISEIYDFYSKKNIQDENVRDKIMEKRNGLISSQINNIIKDNSNYGTGIYFDNKYIINNIQSTKGIYDSINEKSHINTPIIILDYINQKVRAKQKKLTNNMYKSENISLSKHIARTVVHEVGHSLGLEHLNTLYPELKINVLAADCPPNIQSYRTPTKEEFEQYYLGRSISSYQKDKIINKIREEEIPEHHKEITAKEYKCN